MKMTAILFLLLVASCNSEPGWLTAAYSGREPAPLREGYARLDTAPRDGRAIEICLEAPGFQGWCDLMYWDANGGGGRWMNIDDSGTGLMNENDKMHDGTRSGDIVSWKAISDSRIASEIEHAQSTIRRLKSLLIGVSL